MSEELTLYTAVGCGKCIVLKRMLDAKNIIYETVTNVEEVSKVAQLIGTMELPILNIDGVFYSGSEAIIKIKGEK